MAQTCSSTTARSRARGSRASKKGSTSNSASRWDPKGAKRARSDLPSKGAADRTLLIESCVSTWIFDEDNHRFRRRLRSKGFGLPVVTDWRPYDRLLIDHSSDVFVVFLDQAGSRVLRVRRHAARCECDAERAVDLDHDLGAASASHSAAARSRPNYVPIKFGAQRRGVLRGGLIDLELTLTAEPDPEWIRLFESSRHARDRQMEPPRVRQDKVEISILQRDLGAAWTYVNACLDHANAVSRQLLSQQVEETRSSI